MKRIALLILAALLCFLPVFVSAAGVGIDIDCGSAEIGKEFSVNVTFKADGIGAVDADFSYDKDMLSFTGGNNATAASGTGRIIAVAGGETSALTVTLSFKALKAGDTPLSVTVNEALTFQEQSLGQASVTDLVTITGEKAAETEPAPTETAAAAETAAPTDAPTPAPETITVHIDGEKLLLAKKLPSAPPSGYRSVFTQYNSDNIEIAQNENSGELLAYVYDSDMDGAYYIWDKANGIFTRTLNVRNTVLLLPLPDELPAELSGYSRSVIAAGSKDAECLITEYEDIRIVYASKNGTAGFYMYDTAEGTLQRVHDRVLRIEYSQEYRGAAAEAEAAVKGPGIIRILTYVAIGIAAVLLIALIVTLIGRRR